MDSLSVGIRRALPKRPDFVRPIAEQAIKKSPSSILIALCVLATIFTSLIPGRADAVSKTWDGGCGATTTWSCANNWSDNIVPAAGDTVTFNATSTNNSTVDAGFNGTETIVTININSGYTGTITLGTTLHVTTSFVQGAGTFSADGQTLDMNGSFTLSAGTFNASSTTTTLAGAMTISGSPTFSANGGTWTFDGDGSGILSCNNVVFNIVSINTTNASAKTINSNCSLPLGSSPTVVGKITLNGTLSGSGNLTLNNGTNTLNSGYSLTGFNGFISQSNLIISGATANFGSYTTFDINGTFTLSSGAVFTAPSGIATFSSGFTLNSGTTFNANGGTVTFDTGGATLTCNNTVFNLVTFAHAGGTKTVNSDCNLPLGNNPIVGGSTNADISLSGTLSGTGTLTIGITNNNDLTLNSGYILSGFSGLVVNGVFTATGSIANFGSYTTFDINSSFILSSGAAFTAPSGSATFAGNFTLNSGTTFNANSGTVAFDGTTGGTIACNNAVFSHVTFDHTLGQKVVSTGCTMPLGNNPVLSAGVTLQGTFTGSGVITGHAASNGAGRLQLDPTYSLVGFSGLAPFTLTIATNTTADLSSFQPLDITLALNMSPGAVLTAPSGTMSIGGGLSIDGAATFNANGGIVQFNGSSSNITYDCSNTTFNKVIIAKTISDTTLNTFTVSADCNFPLGNNPSLTFGTTGLMRLIGTLSGSGSMTVSDGILQIRGGYALAGFTGLVAYDFRVDQTAVTADFSSFNTFDVNNDFAMDGPGSTSTFKATSANMTVGGDFSIGDGASFDANGGTVILDGGNQTISGLVTLYNLNKTVASAATLTLPNGQDETIQGSLTLKGASGQLLSLVSASPGTQWQVSANGNRTLQYLDVSDSLNLSSSTMVTCNSVDSGGNTDWSFNPTSCNPPTTTPGSYPTTSIPSMARADAIASDVPSSEAAASAANEDKSTSSDSLPDTSSSPQATHDKPASQINMIIILLGLLGLALVSGLIFFLIRRRNNAEEMIYPQ